MRFSCKKVIVFIEIGHLFLIWNFEFFISGDEVFYIDCTNVPLEHLELVVREVYLPLMCTNQSVMSNTGGDKVMDVLHRLMSSVEITQGHVEVIWIFLNKIDCILYLKLIIVHIQRQINVAVGPCLHLCCSLKVTKVLSFHCFPGPYHSESSLHRSSSRSCCNS